MATLGQEEAPAASEFGGTSRYEVRRLFGTGSFGVVYEAYDRVRSSTVALKWLRYALSRWSQRGFTLLQFWELFSSTEAQLYAGRPEAAYARVDAQRTTVYRSGLLQVQMYEVTWRDLEGRCALASAARAHGRRRRKLLGEVTRCAKRIIKSGAPWGRGFAATLYAGVASLRKDRRTAVREIERAERAFFDSDMALHTTVARCRLAELERSPQGRDAGLEALGLDVPESWLTLLAPGDWSA